MLNHLIGKAFLNNDAFRPIITDLILKAFTSGKGKGLYNLIGKGKENDTKK